MAGTAPEKPGRPPPKPPAARTPEHSARGTGVPQAAATRLPPKPVTAVKVSSRTRATRASTAPQADSDRTTHIGLGIAPVPNVSRPPPKPQRSLHPTIVVRGSSVLPPLPPRRRELTRPPAAAPTPELPRFAPLAAPTLQAAELSASPHQVVTLDPAQSTLSAVTRDLPRAIIVPEAPRTAQVQPSDVAQSGTHGVSVPFSNTALDRGGPASRHSSTEV
ncbi:MAG: hypothetical protein RJA70_3941, partial [Pseudomonadota bacterium]